MGAHKLKGIYKSACEGKIYGYYAKAVMHNFMFVTRTHKHLAGAIGDHILLMEILEHIRHKARADQFPMKVREAADHVLREACLQPVEFFRHFTIACTAHHWIGRGLFVC